MRPKRDARKMHLICCDTNYKLSKKDCYLKNALLPSSFCLSFYILIHVAKIPYHIFAILQGFLMKFAVSVSVYFASHGYYIKGKLKCQSFFRLSFMNVCGNSRKKHIIIFQNIKKRQSEDCRLVILFKIFHCRAEQADVVIAVDVSVETVADSLGMSHLAQHSAVG